MRIPLVRLIASYRLANKNNLINRTQSHELQESTQPHNVHEVPTLSPIVPLNITLSKGAVPPRFGYFVE